MTIEDRSREDGTAAPTSSPTGGDATAAFGRGSSEAAGSGGAARGWLGRLGRLLPLAILIAGLAAFLLLGGQRYVSLSALEEHHESLKTLVDQAGWGGLLAYVLVYAGATAFSIPGGALLTIVGGFLFGTGLGTACVVVGATAGACAVFLAARTALADLLRRQAQGWIGRFERGFRDDAFSFLLFLRLIPLFPFWLVNLVPAFLGVPLRIYALATVLGIIPGAFVYASVGNGVGAILEAGGKPELGVIFSPEILIPIVGLACLALLPVVYKRVSRRRRGPHPEALP